MKAHTMTAHTHCAALRTRRHLCLAAYGLLLVAMALPTARAAETSAAAASALKVLALPQADADSPMLPQRSAAPESPAERRLITVQKGESIEAVLRRGLPGMPLKDEFMRQALAKANPKIFPRGQTYPVRPGTVLALPSVDDLRQLILLQSPQAAALFQGSPIHTDSDTAQTHSGPDKRRWVRFP